MTKRLLKFDGQSEDHRQYCKSLYYGFINGGDVLLQRNQGKRERSERGLGADILDAFTSVWADSSAKEPQLSTGGGTITLTQEQHDLLFKYLDACPWGTSELRLARKLVDWVMAAPEQQKETAKEANA